MTLQSRYVQLMVFFTAEVVVFITPPPFNFVACLMLGLMVGTLYRSRPSLFLCGSVSLAIGLIAAYLSQAFGEDPDDMAARITGVVILSMALFFLGYLMGGEAIDRLYGRIWRRQRRVEVGIEYEIFFRSGAILGKAFPRRSLSKSNEDDTLSMSTGEN